MIFGKRRINSTFCQVHQHDQHELNVALAENRCIYTGAGKVIRRRGDIAFYPAGVPHGVRRKGKGFVSLLYLCFDTEHFSRLGMNAVSKLIPKLAKSDCYTMTSNLGEAYIANAERAVEELENPTVLSEEKATAIVAELLIDFARSVIPGEIIELKSFEDRVDRLRKRIIHSPAEPYSLDWAARQTGVCRSEFTRRFKDATGMTFIEQMNAIRLEKAFELCANSEVPIGEIAYLCGYENLGHFHNLFKKKYETTPLACRKRILSGERFPMIVGNARVVWKPE